MLVPNKKEHIPPDQWGIISISLHWLTFILVISLAGIGLWMTDLPNNPFKIQVYSLHKNIGLTVFALTWLRLLWRMYRNPPTAVAGTPHWQELIAKMTHGLLYALLLAVPVSGWLFNSAAGFPLKWFGLFTVPKLGGYNPPLKAFARELHETLFYVMAALVVLHAAAALWHHYRLGDRTLVRMLPWIKPFQRGH